MDAAATPPRSQPLRPRWRLVLFGGLRAEQNNGAEVVSRFRSQKIGALLAYLALHPQQLHAREELADLFWPDAEPEAARTNLRTALSSLRRQLEPPGVPAGSFLVTRGHSDVGLEPAAFTTDVAAFERAVQAAARRSTPPEEQARLLAEAVALYTGPLLPGFYETWALSERDRLAEAYLRALRDLTGIYERAGALDRALEFARRAVGADRLSEEAHADVVRLLMASGQTAAARRHYEQLERLLDEELGCEPSPDIRALLSVKAERRPTPVAAAARLLDTAGPVTDTPPAIPIHLPLTLTRFFGREEEMARIGEAFRGEGARLTDAPARLLTLTGPGGSGKTRLAVEAARRLPGHFAGGVWFVALADLRDAARLFDVIADALELPRSPSAPPLDQVAEALTRRGGAGAPLLLVLDNFEQIAEEAAPLVATLLARVPALSCLVTSRQRLLLEGEREFPLAPLPTPARPGAPERLLEFASVQLFVNRAQSARPDFQLRARNAEAVAGLCARLEGVPLAIELAAAWAQTLTPAQMHERLRQRFDLLVARRRDAPGRHRSLRAAVEWGWELLPPEAQRFFARLSVFRGGWTLEAAEAVTDRSDALLLLSELRDRSFLVTEETGDAGYPGGVMRYRMLETLREFAEEQAGSAEERAALGARHFD